MRYSQRSRLLPFRRGETVMELKGSYRMPRRGIPNEFLNRADAMECEAAASFPEPPPCLFLFIASFHPLALACFLLRVSSFLEGIWKKFDAINGHLMFSHIENISCSLCLTSECTVFFLFFNNNDRVIVVVTTCGLFIRQVTYNYIL